MNNRLAQVGFLIAALVAAPAVTSAQDAGTNPWRATPQSNGHYAPRENGVQAMRVPQSSQPNYAPLDGSLPERKSNAGRYGQPAAPAPMTGTYGTPYGPGVTGLGYGAPVFGGYGYPGLGYSGLGYPGLGYGYPGLGYSGLGYPGSWGGTGPLSGWNNFGGPLSWMPFW